MIPLTTIGMLAADGWVYGVFAELRGQAVGGASKSVGLAFAIGCIIVALKMIRIAYDMMSDEQGGGMGSLRLSQILRPLVLLLAIQAAGTILSTFDGVVTGVTSGISHSYSSASVSLAFSKAVDAVESALGDTVGEDIVQRAKDIDDRPSITAEQVQDIMTSGMTGGAVFGTMISGWIQKRKDRNALDQEAAERLREQAGDDVAEAQDDGQGGILKNVKAIAAMDRAESFSGNSGPMSCELRAALFNAKLTPDVLSMVYGLGGRDITVEDMEKIYGDLMAGNFECKELPYRYVNVRE